jgi:L-alanine-DL-glutamate epimerase-like enolase superfamily enzyme
MATPQPVISRIEARAYRVPTEQPEADGTYQWDSTTLVLGAATASDGSTGRGYSYTAAAAAGLIREMLAGQVQGCPVDQIGLAWQQMVGKVRNVGRQGLAAAAISAVDVALWDLRARRLQMPLFQLLGAVRSAAPLYGSGGFTSYSLDDLTRQLGGWVAAGMTRVKMKIGADWGTRPEEDVERVRAARDAIGPRAQLFVDANGAYTARLALQQADRFAELGVTYFEEPVVFDNLDQLAFVRRHAPMAIAAGEYGWDVYSLRNVLLKQAVDVLQADATRCLGITGCLQAGQLAFSFGVPFSTHTAPSIHAHVACAVPQIEHIEYFYDHVRIEHLLFDGAATAEGDVLRPSPDRPGLGLTLKAEAQDWRVEA